MSSFGFDVGNTAPQAAFDPLPPGWYAMRVIRAEMADGKHPGTGQMLRVTFEIVDHAHPEFAGRRAFANFCHHHEKKQTRDIARAQIAAISQAIGKRHAQSTDEWLGGELFVKLSVVPADGQYEARNECKGYKSLTAVAQPTSQTTSQPVAAQSAPQPSAGTAAPQQAQAQRTPTQPWKR